MIHTSRLFSCDCRYGGVRGPRRRTHECEGVTKKKKSWCQAPYRTSGRYPGFFRIATVDHNRKPGPVLTCDRSSAILPWRPREIESRDCASLSSPISAIHPMVDHPTASWDAMQDGKVFYRRQQAYNISNKLPNLDDFVVAGCKYGGPLGMVCSRISPI